MKRSEAFIQHKTNIAITMIVMSLCGCGGGGGGGGSANGGSVSGSTTPTPVDAGNLLTVMPTASYVVGSREAEIFAAINAARGTDFGYARQSAALDRAAVSHASYLQRNMAVPVLDPDGNQYTVNGVKMFELGPAFLTIDPATGTLGAHVESAGQVGFTGVLPNDRTTAAGYLGGSTEVVANEPPQAQQYSLPCVANLVNTVFHRGALLNPEYAEVGIGLATLPGLIDRTCVISLGSPSSNLPRPADDWTGVYPPNGSTGIPRAMWNREAPDPVPEFAVMGAPISVYTKAAMTVSKFTLTGPNGEVPAKMLTSASALSYIRGNQAYLVPNGALLRNTKYTVEFTVVVGGQSISRKTTFTTVVADGRCDDGKTLGCT